MKSILHVVPVAIPDRVYYPAMAGLSFFLLGLSYSA